MLSVIACALVNSLAQHIFTNILNEQNKIQIGNAPSWYMKPVEDKMCVFTHSSGGYNSIKISKDNAKIKMIKSIDNLIDIAIYDNTKHIKKSKEKELIKLWAEDENLNTFVSKNLNYSKIIYEDEVDTTFVRACISKQTIIDYQDDRLENIQKSLLKYKMNNALDELDEALKIK
jgi:hypothetical protein